MENLICLVVQIFCYCLLFLLILAFGPLVLMALCYVLKQIILFAFEVLQLYFEVIKKILILIKNKLFKKES